MKNFLLFLGISGFCLSCGSHYSPEVETALRLAGSNRRELKKALKHYRRNPSDSLKHKAAEFLIANMPGKYSEYHDAPWNDVATVSLRWTSSSDKQRVLDTYKLSAPVRREDVKHVTSGYLISNIELAFGAWRNKPWGKHISFETFCEEILPYRIGTEPLENWREKALASFADVDKALREDSAMTAVSACAKVNSLLPRFRLDKDFPAMCYSQLMASTRSMCDGQTALAAFVMRALGIPVTVDFTTHWAKLPTGHDWNSVCDSSGRHISFMGTETNPYESHQGNTLLKSKAYRKTFARNRIINAGENDIPPVFNRDMKDISAEHPECVDVKIPALYPPNAPTGYAYLALLYDAQWHIAAYGSIESGLHSSDSINFPAVGKNIVYLPVYYENGSQHPAGRPFMVDSSGHTVAFGDNPPDSLLRISLVKSDLVKSDNDNAYFSRMVNGIFEGANEPDFSDAEIIHTIKKLPDVHNNVALSGKRRYRYLRYKSPENGSCNVAEIEFWGASGEKLNGAHIGTAGSYKNTGAIGNKAFDGDVATFYDAAEPSGAWTGLDLGKQQKITAIRYIPRNKAYVIYTGQVYELFYWDSNRWKSLGRQAAVGMAVEFRAPSQGVFYIVNLKTQKMTCFIISVTHKQLL